MTPREPMHTDESSRLVGAHPHARHRADPADRAPRIRDRRRRARSSRGLALAAVLGVVAGIGLTSSAAAYWTASGTATATGGTGTVVAVRLESASTVGTLRPGGAVDVSVVARNPNPTAVRIRALELDPTAGTNGYDIAAGCGTSALAFVGANGPAGGWQVPAATDGSDGTLTIVVPGALHLTENAADACQSQPVTVHLRELEAIPSYAARIAASAATVAHHPLDGGVPGRVGTATRYADSPTTVSSPLRGAMTVEAWFASTRGAGTGAGWYFGAGIVDADLPYDRRDWGIALMADGTVRAGFGGDTGAQERRLASRPGYADGAWHHVAVTRIPGGAVRLYLDGRMVDEQISPVTADVEPTTAVIGGIQGESGHRFAGDIDEVALIGAALTPSQIATHYRAGVLGR
jgi:hypothetical protein